MAKNIFFDADIYRATSGYGMRTLAGKAAMHNGEDWGTGEGTGIFSIRPGGILNCWSDPIAGNITSITYNDLGLRFQFHHCKEFIRQTGYKPAAGELFGLTGKTGNAAAPHAHIEVFENAHITDSGVIDRKGTRVNPNKYTTNMSIYNKPTAELSVAELVQELSQLIAKYSK